MKISNEYLIIIVYIWLYYIVNVLINIIKRYSIKLLIYVEFQMHKCLFLAMYYMNTVDLAYLKNSILLSLHSLFNNLLLLLLLVILLGFLKKYFLFLVLLVVLLMLIDAVRVQKTIEKINIYIYNFYKIKLVIANELVIKSLFLYKMLYACQIVINPIYIDFCFYKLKF